MARGRAFALVLLALCGSTGVASSKPSFDATAIARPFAEIEAQVKQLPKGKDPSASFDAFAKWLGLSTTCPTDACKSIASTKWIAANLDADADDEKVLAITTLGDGTCAQASLRAFFFDSTPKGWIVVGYSTISIAGGASTQTDVSAASVHSSSMKDLVLKIDGQCTGSTREQMVVVSTLDGGKLQDLADSADYFGTSLVSYKLTGSAPVNIELEDGKDKKKLWFDATANAYDALPTYDYALKNTVSKDDADTLSTKECAAPLGGEMAVACNLDGTAKVEVAVVNGKAIGATVTVTPAKPKVVRCMRKRIALATWPSLPGLTGCVRTFKAS